MVEQEAINITQICPGTIENNSDSRSIKLQSTIQTVRFLPVLNRREQYPHALNNLFHLGKRGEPPLAAQLHLVTYAVVWFELVALWGPLDHEE